MHLFPFPENSLEREKAIAGERRKTRCLPKLFASLVQQWPDAEVNRLDGLRLDWPKRWLHVRPSNTEPIGRVIAEAPRAEEAMNLCREVGELLHG